MNMPPGYSHAPDWLNAVLEPYSAEMKDLTERAWTAALETCRARPADLGGRPEEWAMSALIGVGTQFGLMAIAKALEVAPNAPFDAQANRIAMLIHNATVLNFGQCVADLASAQAEASGATKQ